MFLSKTLIRCAGGRCNQYVRADGQAVVEHTELNHKFQPGEKAYVCRRCRNDFRKMTALTGPGGNWTIGKTHYPCAETT